MEESIDYNKIIAELINSKTHELLKIGENIFTGTKEKVQIELKLGYTSYLESVFERYGKSKTFFFRDSNEYLETFYVPLSIKCNEVKIKTANLKAILEVNKNSIISGTGGAGKSIMLKHLFVNSLFSKKQIPIFIELRDLNSKPISLENFIKKTLNSFGLDLDKKFIEKSLNKGQYILFLDGLDEVFTEKREKLLIEIDNLTKKYNNSSIILSTRPDLNISQLTTFSVFNVLPLTIDKSISLIEKLPADELIKTKFIEDLKNSLFEKHNSFLSNPLLLSIMLLTYGYSADIPNKLSVFYNQAFEALFQRHDALKGAFNRKRETNLDIQEFSKILSIFCILTYEQRKFKFTNTEALKFIEQAKELSCYEFNNEKFLQDLLQSVCLLVEDGLFIYFTHRSFQEYFTAKYIVESQTDIKTKLLQKYQTNIREDSVYKLVYELDPDFIEFEIILPFINNLFEKINLNKKVGITHYLKFVKIMWSRFEFRHSGLFGTVEENNEHKLHYFTIINISSEKNLEYIKSVNSSEWIKKQYLKYNDSQKESLVFETKKLKTTDKIIIELFEGGTFFSKRVIEVLYSIKINIEQRKKNQSEKLFSLLLKK